MTSYSTSSTHQSYLPLFPLLRRCAARQSIVGYHFALLSQTGFWVRAAYALAFAAALAQPAPAAAACGRNLDTPHSFFFAYQPRYGFLYTATVGPVGSVRGVRVTDSTKGQLRSALRISNFFCLWTPGYLRTSSYATVGAESLLASVLYGFRGRNVLAQSARQQAAGALVVDAWASELHKASVVEFSATFRFLIKPGFVPFTGKATAFFDTLTYLLDSTLRDPKRTRAVRDRMFHFPTAGELSQFSLFYCSLFFYNFFEASSTAAGMDFVAPVARLNKSQTPAQRPLRAGRLASGAMPAILPANRTGSSLRTYRRVAGRRFVDTKQVRFARNFATRSYHRLQYLLHSRATRYRALERSSIPIKSRRPIWRLIPRRRSRRWQRSGRWGLAITDFSRLRARWNTRQPHYSFSPAILGSRYGYRGFNRRMARLYPYTRVLPYRRANKRTRLSAGSAFVALFKCTGLTRRAHQGATGVSRLSRARPRLRLHSTRAPVISAIRSQLRSRLSPVNAAGYSPRRTLPAVIAHHAPLRGEFTTTQPSPYDPQPAPAVGAGAGSSAIYPTAFARGLMRSKIRGSGVAGARDRYRGRFAGTGLTRNRLSGAAYAPTTLASTPWDGFKDQLFSLRTLLTPKRTDMPTRVVRYSVPVFQMKPGYQSKWRLYRREYKILAKLSYFRQRRLTNYFLNFKRISGFPLLVMMELSLFSILRASKFFSNDATVTHVLLAYGIWVNGTRVHTPLAQIYTGDCVQVCVDPSLFWRYQLDFAWLKSQRARLITKSLKLVGYIASRASFSVAMHTSWVLTQWLTRLGFASLDIPNYLEVDYLSATIFLLYTPRSYYDINSLLLNRLPVSAMRMYNWKYLN